MNRRLKKKAGEDTGNAPDQLLRILSHVCASTSDFARGMTAIDGSGIPSMICYYEFQILAINANCRTGHKSPAVWGVDRTFLLGQ